jgi:cellobiose phosphorylase
VAPVIPSKWNGFSATRIFRGVRYDISVKRKGKGNSVHLNVDGRSIEGNVIPLPAAGVTQVSVEALLE